MPVAKSSAKPDEERRPHPNAADARRFQYGAITNSIRASLQRAGAYGLSLDDLIGLVSEKLGQAVTAADLRDTLKRLKEKDELRVENGKHRAGPNLKPLNENGAASAAPDAGEATTSPDRPD